MLPAKLIHDIVAVTRKFWWSSQKDKSKIPWVAWNKLTNSKSQDGLGFKDLKDFNVALLAKQSWRLIQNPKARVYKAKYYAKTTLLEAKQKWCSSHAWRSILEGNKLLRKGIRWLMGDGKQIKVWNDNWVSTSPSRLPVKQAHFSTSPP